MSKEEIEKFLDNANAKQKGLLFKLVSTAKQEKEISDKLDRKYSSVKSGIYSPDGHSITVCEDGDNAALIFAKDREKLKRFKAQIKEYMLEAVNLGMGDLEIIKRNYKDYVGEDLPSK